MTSDRLLRTSSEKPQVRRQEIPIRGQRVDEVGRISHQFVGTKQCRGRGHTVHLCGRLSYAPTLRAPHPPKALPGLQPAWLGLPLAGVSWVTHLLGVRAFHPSPGAPAFSHPSVPSPSPVSWFPGGPFLYPALSVQNGLSHAALSGEGKSLQLIEDLRLKPHSP